MRESYELMAERWKGSRAEIIKWGERLFERHLVSGWGGNLSCRFGRSRYLITGSHTALGFLDAKDIVEIDARGNAVDPRRQPSSETPLHLAVYEATDAGAVVHVHPPEIIAYCRDRSEFVPLSFEEEYSLGRVPVIPHDGPTVTDPGPVVEELRLHPVVILQGHGTVARGRDLKEAFLITDLLAEAVHCRLVMPDETKSPA